MTKRIKATPRKAKPASHAPTASKAKARKATARGTHPKQPKPEFPDPLGTDDESQTDEDPQSEQTSEAEDEPKSKPHSRPSDRFKRGPWNSPSEKERTRRSASEKAAKRAQALLPNLTPKQRYDQWSSACDSFFAAPLSSVDHFPRPQGLEKCKEKGARCVMGERLDFCHHQLKEFLMRSGVYDIVWLKKERVRWHPDKFPGQEAVGALAQELFQMLQMLIDSE
jgi:hypothetical protein